MLVLLLLLPLVLLVSCAASFCRLRQNFRALTSRIAVGSCSACCCCSGGVGAKAFFLVLFVYYNTCVGVVLKLLSALLLRIAWVCVSEFRIAWTYFFFIYFALVFVFSAPIYTVKRLLCSVIRVVLSFVYLSLSLPVFSLISSAPIACKMSGNCQLEIMTCLLSEMGGIPHNILIVRIFTE